MDKIKDIEAFLRILDESKRKKKCKKIEFRS